MARIYLKSPDAPEPLVKLTVYLYARDRQALREQAARQGMAMSEYVKHLVAKDRKEAP